ncbi:AcrR family transcriptional regulator [Crossiella equi]|uniref:AcrR family transcriptional regulator n=1 Tax=Crossiella equi TaxID=130796 RepID=A0ABS5A5G7_9PSEU|nr:TetR-like C-terminal domain-containing protein [Crossiella equi]MBP2471531.1 AcrR family transcriptional regulator [Crossiella equi]
MTQATGTTRPGGRTARTRAAVHAATRELLAESADGTVEVAAVAARAGVHAATIYRRWRSAEGLIIDTIVADMTTRSPVPATGELHEDLLTWATNLLTDLRTHSNLAFVRALTRAAANDPQGLGVIAEFMAPRANEIQATLTASGVTGLTAQDVLDLLLAPAYFRALMAAPMDPATDATRLVDNIMAVRAAREAKAGKAEDGRA